MLFWEADLAREAVYKAKKNLISAKMDKMNCARAAIVGDWDRI